VVFKRPYGLLIKYFRLIHIVLTGLLLLILSNTQKIVDFLQLYTKSNYSVNVTDNMASTYINSFLYLYILIALGIILSIYILLRFKKKPNQVYLMALIYYTTLFISVIIASALITSLEDSLWNTQSARLYRDIGNVIFYVQYFFLIMMVIRSLGFDVKKFNFKNDLKELDLSEEDSEEIEISITFNSYKLFRLIRRFIREFKYYFLENKFMFSIIISIFILLIGYLGIKSYEKYTYTYDQGETFSFDSMTFNIKDSIITNLDYNGEVINNKNYFLVLKVEVQNNDIEAKSVDFAKFLVYQNDTYYTPSFDVGSHFIDYGEPYYGGKIASKEKKIVLFSYIIPEKLIKKKFKLNLYTNYTLKKLDFKAKNINVKLNPIILDEVTVVNNLKMNENLLLNGTYLENSSLLIKNYSLTDKYEYNYKKCIKDECFNFVNYVLTDHSLANKKTLLVLDYEFILDKNAQYYRTKQKATSFAEDFFKVRYYFNDGLVIKDLKNVTPDSINNKLVLEVPYEIKEANQIDLYITIRNKTFIINLLNNI